MDIFISFVIVVCCVSRFKCDTSQSIVQKNSTHSTMTSTKSNLSKFKQDIIDELPFTLDHSMKTNNTSESIMDRSLSEKSVIFPSVPSFLTFPTIPTLQPVFETIRLYIKTGYKSYLLLNPEIKMAQCMVKHVYIQYPRMMALFRNENLFKLARRLYFTVVKFINHIFKWSDYEADVQQVAMMTTEEYPRHFFLHHIYTKGIHQRIVRQTTKYEYNRNRLTQNPRAEYTQENKLMMNTDFMHLTNQEDMDPDARIDLNDKTLEREADELFNISKFWKWFGIDPQHSLKKYSLPYCGKEYITDVFRRFVRNVLLS